MMASNFWPAQRMRRAPAGAVIGTLLLLTACGGDGSAPTGSERPLTPSSSQVATVSVSPETFLLTVGDTVRLVAATRDAAGQLLSGRVVSWSSDATAIASVTSAGLVRALSAGLVRITATSEGRTGGASITSR